ncbi:hypothetical protein C4J94_0022 [Pseudomonas sp. R5-89-07]|nr:hypothetical protein C4J94_0022 [Pseudomonas sp. R5-89-07]
MNGQSYARPLGVGGKWAHRIPPHPVPPQLTKIKLRSPIGAFV